MANIEGISVKGNMKTQSDIKYLTRENLFTHLQSFTNGMAVTRGSFELLVPQCTIEDIEWNHMDQMHRPAIHNTYEKGIRIASGNDFAVSLTQWAKWPFFITVTDVYVDKGLFYQSLTIAGIFFLHSIISMEKVGESVKLKDEWYIASKRMFKFLHGILNRKLYKLNTRLQQEDEQVRQGRFKLRKRGYKFNTDIPNYYNSNVVKHNTIYPDLLSGQFFSVDDVGEERVVKKVGGIDYVVCKSHESYYIWPAVCPHEGGPLTDGKFLGAQVTCPWHGLKFTAIELTGIKPTASRYGFEYTLENNKIFVNKTESFIHKKKPSPECECTEEILI